MHVLASSRCALLLDFRLFGCKFFVRLVHDYLVSLGLMNLLNVLALLQNFLARGILLTNSD